MSLPSASIARAHAVFQGLRSKFELADTAADETAVLNFGPNPPAGDRHWETTPGRGWFTFLRIYGPEQPAFDGTWRPGDFEQSQ